jgi:hypothetical protein
MEIFDGTCGGAQIAGVGPIAIAFAFRRTLTPSGTQQQREFFLHQFFHDSSNGTSNLFT